jgi:hypothetical protein
VTKRERAAAAAKWRDLARRIEQSPDGGWFLCCEAQTIGGLAERKRFTDSPLSPGDNRYVWWDPDIENDPRLHVDADDCRIIAAGLMAAMYETGEFDS